MTINQIQDEIIEEFSEVDDWMDRYADRKGTTDIILRLFDDVSNKT